MLGGDLGFGQQEIFQGSVEMVTLEIRCFIAIVPHDIDKSVEQSAFVCQVVIFPHAKPTIELSTSGKVFAPFGFITTFCTVWAKIDP
jgi:hypothetical protein